MTETLEILKAYNGTGYYGMLFIASLLYLYFTEEDTHTKKLLVIVPTVIQVLFLIPYFYMIYNKLDEGTYYRLLWLLPTTLVIAYTACKIIDTHTRLGVIVMAVILALSGTIVYAGSNVSIAENEYNLPDEVIELADMVKPAEGRERVWVAFPPVLVHYVRQYTTEIMLPFGRDSLVDQWNAPMNPLFDLYMEPTMDAAKLSEYATKYYCNYVIVEKDKKVIGDIEDNNFEYVGETANYIVYHNKLVPFWDEIEEGVNFYSFIDELYAPEEDAQE